MLACPHCYPHSTRAATAFERDDGRRECLICRAVARRQASGVYVWNAWASGGPRLNGKTITPDRRGEDAPGPAPVAFVRSETRVPADLYLSV